MLVRMRFNGTLWRSWYWVFNVKALFPDTVQMISTQTPGKNRLLMSFFPESTRLLLAIVVLLLPVLTQAAVPNVPPEIVAQLKSLSPAEQRKLAKQYGFDLDLPLIQGADPGMISGEKAALGAPGEPLEQRLRLDMEGMYEAEALLEVEKDDTEVLERFGSSLFDPEVSNFAPVDNIPVPEGYRLGVGDELRVMLIGKEQGDFPLIIGRDGSVNLPKLGRIVLSGLSFPEAKTLIEKRVNQQLIGSEAIISMGALRSINVFIAGEVKNPGNYSISALSTLSQSIFITGGISDTGTYRNVELKRQGKTVQSFDLYDLLLFGDNSGDVRLRSGDVVFVPVRGPLASISGEVLRPAIYEFKEGETIEGLLSMAGGVLAQGNPQQGLLRRYQPGESLPSIENLNLLEDESLALRALDGDSLSIASMSKRVSNPIAIEGDTELAGILGWAEGSKIADIFRDLEADVEPTADLNLSLVVRRKNSLNDITVLPFSLSKAVLEPSSKDNITLQPFDRIVVLPQATLLENPAGLGVVLDEKDLGATDLLETADLGDDTEEKESRQNLIQPIVEQLQLQSRSRERARVVNVVGAVREPGLYPLIGDGSVADAVALAGGFNDSAYLERVEIRRIQINEFQEAEVEILNINLNKAASERFKLIGRDTLRINAIPNWSTEETVEVTGEVVFPGKYTIYEGETISNLIERAGGFTRDAFLKGARYFSSSARTSQSRQLKKISESMARRLASRDSAVNLEESPTNLAIEAAINEELLGRVVIDMQSILNGDPSADVIVDDGDTIFVPKYSKTIAVVGEVYEPGTFRYEEGLSVDQYIQTAGGATNYALRKNTYLLKADGSVRFYRANRLKNLMRFNTEGESVIEAGDAIVIPANLDYERPLNRVTAITSVIFQSLTSVAAFLSISNQ